MPNRICIGTRGSELALCQTNLAKMLLKAKFQDIIIDVQIIKTKGDNIQDSPLVKINDKGLFIKEIETALSDGHIDLAVHSYKDVPTAIPENLTIGAVLEREDAHDVFISNPKKNHGSFSHLPHNAIIATGSLRRKCQLLHIQPELQIIDIRGNLNTRIKKLDSSSWDGMILARAGISRLGLEQRINEILPFEIMLPAVGQGALAIEIRKRDEHIEKMLHSLNHTPTAIAVTAERALLRQLEGGCQIPIGAFGSISGTEIQIEAVIGSLNGKQIVRGKKSGNKEDAELIGISLAKELLDRGGRDILSKIEDNS